MNILITGGTGLVGYYLQQNVPTAHNILSLYHPAENPSYSPPYPREPIDLTDFPTVSRLMSIFQPNVVIHTAAQSSPDWCQQNKSQATLINTTASINLAKLCRTHHAHFIFLSSNAVYDGNSAPYSELGRPQPINHYGHTKVVVEKFLKTYPVTATVLRPTLMFAWPPPGGRDNQVTRVIKSLTNHQSVNAVYDSWFNPLFVPSLVEIIWRVAANQITGFFNIGGADRMNLLELSFLTAKIFSLDPAYIKPLSVNDSPAIAKRPTDTTFSTAKAAACLNYRPRSVAACLREMKKSTSANLYD